MPATIAAFAASPDRGRGLARDMQVRWALEEVGQPYDVRLLSFDEMKELAHRARRVGSSSYLAPETFGKPVRFPC
jgi:glutathione S-transferase